MLFHSPCINHHWDVQQHFCTLVLENRNARQFPFLMTQAKKFKDRVHLAGAGLAGRMAWFAKPRGQGYLEWGCNVRGRSWAGTWVLALVKCPPSQNTKSVAGAMVGSISVHTNSSRAAPSGAWETQALVLCLPLRALLFGLISELCLPPSDPPGSHRALLFIFLSLSFSLFVFLSVVLSKYLSDLSLEF